MKGITCDRCGKFVPEPILHTIGEAPKGCVMVIAGDLHVGEYDLCGDCLRSVRKAIRDCVNEGKDGE